MPREQLEHMKQWNYENEQWTQLRSHLKHLPLFTRSFDLVSLFFRVLWGVFLKIAFSTYIRLKTKGESWDSIYKKHKKLLIISNHTSHLDAVSITTSIPFKYWKFLYITAAQDYWFSNPLFTFFSIHCLGAIPIDRKGSARDAIKLCLTLLNKLSPIWMILFPEGGRSDTLRPFKKGVSVFSQNTNTPVLFLYLEGCDKLFPKGSAFPRPGNMTVHIGPVHSPCEINTLFSEYQKWIVAKGFSNIKNDQIA